MGQSIRRASPKGLADLLAYNRATASAKVKLLLVLESADLNDTNWSAADTVGDLIDVALDLHPTSTSEHELFNVQFVRQGSQIVMTHDDLTISGLAAPTGSDDVQYAIYVWDEDNTQPINDMVPLVCTDIVTQPTGSGDYAVTDGTGIVLWETDY